ncbi:MAG: hypothetical protein K2X02_05930 [Alphaproteobacteria bacterium]|nr:hypothetical protein [Alphaproteobacteria bacterium]
MKTKKIKLRPNTFKLIYCFVLFLAILSPYTSYAMLFEDESVDNSSNTIQRQNLTIKKSEATEHSDSATLIPVISHAIDAGPEERELDLYNPSAHLPNEVIESILPNDFTIIAHTYVQAFRDEGDENSKTSLVLKCIASLGGFGAGIPGIAAALQAGEYYGSSTLGYVLAASTVLYTGGVACWAIWEFIESAQTSQNTIRLNNDAPLASKVGKTVGSLVLGVFSCTPAVYLAYKYNTVKEIIALSFFYEWIFRALGFYKFLSPIKIKKSYDICEDNTIKNKGVEYIDQSKVHFLRLQRENNETEIPLALKNSNTPNELYSYLNPAFSQQDLSAQQDILPSHYARGIPRKLTQYAALVFPFAGAFVNGVLTFKGFSLITDNTAALAILTGISVLPMLVLDSFATKQVAGGIFDAMYSCRSRVLPSDYFESFHPHLKKAIIAGAVTVSVAASGVVIYFILDNLEGTFLSPVKYVFTALAAVSSIKFGSYAITNTLMNFGTVLTKQIKKTSTYTFNCLKKLDGLRNLIWEADTPTVETFVKEVNGGEYSQY